MLLRNCAGGVVFYEDTVLLIQNDKQEWAFPKGVIRKPKLSVDTAIERVKLETGVDAAIVSSAGETSYEFYSTTRKSPVCNFITWYIMRADDNTVCANQELGVTGGGFFPIEQAAQMITYSQDQSLLKLSYEKYHQLKTV